MTKLIAGCYCISALATSAKLNHIRIINVSDKYRVIYCTQSTTLEVFPRSYHSHDRHMQLGLPIYCTKDGFFPIEPNETDPIEFREVHPDRLYPMGLILTVVETNNNC